MTNNQVIIAAYKLALEDFKVDAENYVPVVADSIISAMTNRIWELETIWQDEEPDDVTDEDIQAHIVELANDVAPLKEE